MAIERVERKDVNSTKIKAIENSLHDMLEKLNDALEDAVKAGKVDKDSLRTILSEIDTLIIEDKEIQGYLLGDSEPARAQVAELIDDVQKAVQETIDNFKNSPDRKNLSAEQLKEVGEVYEEKVTKSATVTRTQVLDEYRTKVDAMTLATAKSKLDEINQRIEAIDAELAKYDVIKPEAGENLDMAKQRLLAELAAVKMDGASIKKINDITTNPYKMEDAAAKIGVNNYSYKQTENLKDVQEFLNQLMSLRAGNPKIEKIFQDLAAEGIKPDKNGKFNLKSKNQKILRKIVNEGLAKDPIDFNEAKTNTCNELLKTVDQDINAVLNLGAMSLHKAQLADWKTRLTNADLNTKLDIWKEMTEFLKNNDLKKEIEDIDPSKKADLEAEKTTLDSKKQRYEKMIRTDRYVETRGNLKSLNVNGLELDVKFSDKRDLLGLTGDDLTAAIANLYQDNKDELLENFNKNAPAVVKNVTWRDRLAYFIKNFKLPTKQRILSQRAATWSKQEIAESIIDAANKKGKAAEEALEFGALPADELKRVRDAQRATADRLKKEQAKAIVEGKTKTADEAVKTVKEQADEELDK